MGRSKTPEEIRFPESADFNFEPRLVFSCETKKMPSNGRSLDSIFTSIQTSFMTVAALVPRISLHRLWIYYQVSHCREGKTLKCSGAQPFQKSKLLRNSELSDLDATFPTDMSTGNAIFQSVFQISSFFFMIISSFLLNKHSLRFCFNPEWRWNFLDASKNLVLKL